MENSQILIICLANFLIVALASKEIGRLLTKIKLPLISGFLMAGALAGPFGLNLITTDAVERLGFIDEISLAVIAFAAGSELYMKELKSRLKSIMWISVMNVLLIPTLSGLAIFLMSDFIPFMSVMPTGGRIAVSLLAGVILIALSPSSTIALVSELKAKGPFTKTALGVTMVIDIVVIVLFAINSSVANAVLTNVGVDLGFIALLGFDLVLSVALGYALGKFLQLTLSLKWSNHAKAFIIIASGYGVFAGAHWVADMSYQTWGLKIHLESLLVCMVASFFVTNYTKFRHDLEHIIHEVSPAIYLGFFTLTGAALQLDVVVAMMSIAMAIFAIRLVILFTASYTGGVLAGEPAQYNRLGWMTYITQAGVGLGLAKGVAVTFPEWGGAFATLVISVIVIGQLLGPPFFKLAIGRVGEINAGNDASEHEVDEIYKGDIVSLPQVNPQPTMAAARKMLGEGKAATVARIKSIQPAASNEAGAMMASSNS